MKCAFKFQDNDISTIRTIRQMHTRTLFLLVILSIVATIIAIPLPDEEPENKRSLGQHLGQVGFWMFGGLAMIGMAIGGVTYGTNWWHRFKSMQAEHEGNRTAWEAARSQKEQEHLKNMEALDIILDVTRNYTDTVGKEKAEFDPVSITKELESEVQDAQIAVNKEE